MTRPRLLDAFSGAGGCAVGYRRAGFDVVGVDIKTQPRYPYEHHVGDALEFIEAHGREFDAIHASPPCPGYANVTLWRGSHSDHPRLIAPVRGLLLDIGVPWVIENVRTRELRHPVMLCGTAFGLRVRRHRYFETSAPMPMLQPPCRHRLDDVPFDHGGRFTESAFRDAVGCPWMNVHEARDAIPPPMAEWIGTALLASMRAAA